MLFFHICVREEKEGKKKNSGLVDELHEITCTRGWETVNHERSKSKKKKRLEIKFV